MQIGLDSATPPTASQVAAAKAAGVGMWAVYLATKPNVGLYRAWTDAEIERVRPINAQPIAFCSGWDDPAALKAAAARLRLRLCIDVEGGIRADGPWLQPMLDQTGAGLYSFASAFPNRRMAFAILADRSRTPPDPHATWAPWLPHPSVPCGWQWWGTHNEFGVGVDRLWLDDWFAPTPQLEVEMIRLALPDGAQYLLSGNLLAGINTAADAQALDAAGVKVASIALPFFNSIKAAIAAQSAPGAGAGGSASIAGTLTITPK